MTRKDYHLIVKALRMAQETVEDFQNNDIVVTPETVIPNLVLPEFCKMLAMENPKFNAETFNAIFKMSEGK